MLFWSQHSRQRPARTATDLTRTKADSAQARE